MLRRWGSTGVWILVILILTGCGRDQATAQAPRPAPAPLPSSTPTASPLPTPTVSILPSPTPQTAPIPVYTYRVVNEYPHDPGAWTQGLVYVDDTLYEGTGLWGRSTLRRVDLETGEVVQMHELPDEYYGEGIAVYADRIAQLTWKAQTGFVYDRESFEQIATFTYATAGWGLTYNGEHLIMSDGSNVLRFLDPQSFAEVGQVPVFANGVPVAYLNELEWIDGEIYANVWQTDFIARIDPTTGQVTAWIDLAGLLTPEEQIDANVLNGIAYDDAGDRLFVTGKLWPKLFEIELSPAR